MLSTSARAAADQSVEMETLVKRLSQSLAEASSSTLDFQLVRSLISNCWKSSTELNTGLQEELLPLAIQLLEGLPSGSWPVEEQLLLSTAFCTVLGLSVPRHEAVRILRTCLQPTDGSTTMTVSFSRTISSSLSVKQPERFQLGLCHGLLQCRPSHILQGISGAVYTDLLVDVFNVAQKLCRQYSRLTLVAFRVLVRWLQVLSEVGEPSLVDTTAAKTIFAIVNYNWESPISGVRKENLKILEMLVDICNGSTAVWDENAFAVANLLPTVLHEQPWKMKSKYFMLAVLLPRHGVVTALSEFPDLAPSLVSTVQHPHLVSAGCDVYRVCLKHIHQQDLWRFFFLEPIVQALAAESEDDVGKRNLYNYWLKPTLKSFPSVLLDLLKRLVPSMEAGNTAAFLPVISLVQLGRKEGLIGDLWDSDWIPDHTKAWRANFLSKALQHSSENVRNHAFGAVCVSAKVTLFPSELEFCAVRQFLTQNASADSAPLRQGILSSFICFLLRLRDSFLHEIKNYNKNKTPSTLTAALDFLEWLHLFGISNLKPGTNYQRKIVSLRLFQEVLRYFDDDNNTAMDINRKNGTRRKGSSQGVKVKKYALKYNRWHFNSEESQKCLLECLMDPTDDIREAAGDILIGHFGNFDVKTGQIEETEKLMKKALDLCGSPLFYETESGALMVKVAANMVHNSPQKVASSVDVNHLVSRLAYSEPRQKFPSLNRRKIVEKFQLFNFFDRSRESNIPSIILPEESEPIAPEKEESGREQQKEVEEDEVEALFSPTAQKLLAALKVHGHRRKLTIRKIAGKNVKYTPGKFEGLIVRDREAIAKLSGTDASLVHETFEGLSVVDPVSGEVGQELNFPRPTVTDKQHSPKKPRDVLHPDQNTCTRDRGTQATPQPISENRSGPELLSPCSEISSEQNDAEPPAMVEQNHQKANLLHKGDHERIAEILNCSPNYSGPRRFVSKKKRYRRNFKLDVNGTLMTEQVEVPLMQRHRRRRQQPRTATSPFHASPRLWSTRYDPEGSGKPTGLQLPEPTIRDRHLERTSVSPAPSLDWDNCGDVLPFHDEQLASQAESVPVMLDEWGEDWWEMSSPASMIGLLLYHAWAQWRALCKDMCRAVCSGSPLHGLLGAMKHLVAQDIPVTHEECREMVALLEDVIQHLLKVLASKASKASVAPSFAEMSEAIEEAIQQSYSATNSKGEHISPAHQLVLNCMWLNLKACCMLASELVRNRSMPAELVKRCEQVIVQVLLRCRHKGAIEAAGMALAAFTRTITSPEEHRVLCGPNGKQTDVKLLPTQLLMQFLDSLQRSTNRVATSRRSAGLSILVHKIVANDVQPGRPLVEKCVLRLLELAHSPVQYSPAQLDRLKCDLPQAQALHFLCTLMQDSGLRQDMAPHVCDTALLCFHNFASPIWTIRNAALQLFGALVPKLVGEKKFQDDDLEGYGNITIEEFFSHYPRLVMFLLTTLSNCNTQLSPTLAQHSSLVPVLSLLSKLSVGGYSLMEESLMHTIQSFNAHFINLLSSKIFAVRKTAAKAFARFVELPKIRERIVMFIKVLSQEQPNENETHGILLVLKYLKERLLSDGKDLARNSCKLEDEFRKLFEISFINSVSWLNKALVAEVCGTGFVTYSSKGNVCPLILLKQVLYTLKLHKSNDRQIGGIYHWALIEAEFIFKSCREEDLCEVWRSSFNSNWDELAIKYLCALENKLSADKPLSPETKRILFTSLHDASVGVQWLKSYDLLYHIYRTLLLLVTEHSIGRDVPLVSIQMLYLENHARKEIGIHSWSIVLPLTCALIAAQMENTIRLQIGLLYRVTHHIVERTNPCLFNESCRLDAAKSFCMMYRIICGVFGAETRGSQASYETLLVVPDIFKMVLDAGIAFLQDEDSDVRKEAAKFVDDQLNPYACLERLLEPALIVNTLSRQEAMSYFCAKLINFESCKETVQNLISSEPTEVVTSPFDHGMSNIYAEEISVVHLLGKNLLLLIEDADSEMKFELDVLLPISLIEEDLNAILSYAYYAKKAGIINTTARATFHVIDEKLNYLLKVKLALKGANVENLQNIIDEYQKHLQKL